MFSDTNIMLVDNTSADHIHLQKITRLKATRKMSLTYLTTDNIGDRWIINVFILISVNKIYRFAHVNPKYFGIVQNVQILILFCD